MNFPDETSEMIKPFLSHFNKYKSKPLSRTDDKKLNLILLNIYNDIHNAYKKVDLLSETDCFKSVVDDDNKPDNYDAKYFPQQIRSYIEKHSSSSSSVTYNCPIGERKIKIVFTLFSDTNENKKLDNDAKMIYVWLTLCSVYANKTCSKSLTIYIYKTPFDKSLPENSMTTLSSEHVNTAFTMSCLPKNEIVIYRNEEWFKVFIHESFHAFGLDFSMFNSTKNIIHDGLSTLFPIKSAFNSYESYTETWARIINCCFYSYNALTNKKDKKQFIINSTFCLELERMFTIYQCNKVLRFMGLQYTDICNSGDKNVSLSLRKNLYRENTNVFAYYIMSAMFMNNYFAFLNWCDENNTVEGHDNNNNNNNSNSNSNSNNNNNIIKFKNTENNYKSFIHYISRHYKCEDLIEGIENMNEMYKKLCKNSTNNKNNKNNKNKLFNTTRMTLLG